ncbi:MAG: hypothetical protein IIW67_05920, partial [Peptococcaceae bacterium]|nr:hypothetical protein [Peptococcaceae bacterium]
SLERRGVGWNPANNSFYYDLVVRVVNNVMRSNGFATFIISRSKKKCFVPDSIFFLIKLYRGLQQKSIRINNETAAYRIGTVFP